MLLPKLVSDYSHYLNKEFVITEDFIPERPLNFDGCFVVRPLLKGTRFIIKEIENLNIVIKVSNNKKELEELGMCEWDFTTFNHILKLESYKELPKDYKKLIFEFIYEKIKYHLDIINTIKFEPYWNR